MIRHLAIFKAEGAREILSGERIIESRFSKSKIAPFGAVSVGDIVYIKVSGGDIIGQFKVKRVIFFDGIDKEEIKNNYKEEVKENCRYATLIFIGDSTTFITSPIKIKKKDQRGWVVLG